MTLEETETDNPFAETVEETNHENTYWGLRNTEPAITPEDVGRELDINAEWWQHLGAGFIKQSSSGGVEAWQHYVVAAIVIILFITDTETNESHVNDTSTTESNPDTEFEFQGPQ